MPSEKELMQRALALLQAGDKRAAVQELRKVLAGNPHLTQLNHPIAKLMHEQGEVEASLPYFQRAVQHAPQDFQLLFEWAMALHQTGRSNASMEVLEKLLRQEPRAAGAHHLLTVIHWQAGRKEQAWEHCQEAMALDGKNPDVTKNYYQILSEMKGPEAARMAMEHFVRWVDARSDRQKAQDLAQLASSDGKGFVRDARGMNLRQVVFVADDPRIRQAKMAFALKQAGWETVLLHKLDPNFSIADYFTESHRYRTEWEALELARKYHPKVYHLCTIWADSTSTFLLSHKPGRCVYDYWDVVEGLAMGVSLLSMQRACIDMADGLCCRDLRARYVGDVLRSRENTKRILFQDYCWDKPAEPPINRFSDGIHAVSCGYIGIEKRGETDNGYLRIAKTLANQGIHFHIYPHPSQQPFESLFSDYLALEQESPYVHMHRSVPMEQVIPELQRYHLGVTLVDALIFQDSLRGYSERYLQNCGSARIFDFLDAGLPVLHNKELRFQFQQLERYGIVLDTPRSVLENLRPHLDRLLDAELPQRVARARRSLSVRSQISRLTEFYESL